ncbi:uncharacterized protein M421DRAFT_144330 [Didymella exigua CBS 183.55]|uniref:Uncharacterized protein n=1 Tax=Didymella exigua CBS 183.55 TaxID=1150837 RepID=A0A6A5RPM5_9PLEO|nr:uncharacterized protein M421DRAFT_144330 [Didymella exigua CBS 183.55]KAF1928994.1 hypothetical protein M421DRAFT_144330 [Didymella exigua CBS 183.55]
MSPPIHTQRLVHDAASNAPEPTPGTSRTLPVPSPQPLRSALFVCLVGVSILVTVEWILFIAAFSVNMKLNDRYFSYLDAGLQTPADVDYPPLVTRGRDRDIDGPLVMCLLPLGYDSFFLMVISGWACHKRLPRVLVLCVSVLAFPMWSICGSFNVFLVLSAREETWDPAFNSLYGFFTALQVLSAVTWLAVLIAAARSIDKRKKERWMAEGVERALRRQRAEEHQLQDLPAYQA